MYHWAMLLTSNLLFSNLIREGYVYVYIELLLFVPFN